MTERPTPNLSETYMRPKPRDHDPRGEMQTGYKTFKEDRKTGKESEVQVPAYLRHDQPTSLMAPNTSS